MRTILLALIANLICITLSFHASNKESRIDSRIERDLSPKLFQLTQVITPKTNTSQNASNQTNMTNLPIPNGQMNMTPSSNTKTNTTLPNGTVVLAPNTTNGTNNVTANKSKGMNIELAYCLIFFIITILLF